MENQFTLEGTYSHENVDVSGSETNGCIRAVSALPLFSELLGLSGKADIVEFFKISSGEEQPYPVDYKRGRKTKWNNDDVQLCAQALCLGEMLGCEVPKGAIYHIKSKKRREVVFDSELLKMTHETIISVHELLTHKQPPTAVLMPRCNGCSLEDFCLPQLNGKQGRAELSRLFCVGKEKGD